MLECFLESSPRAPRKALSAEILDFCITMWSFTVYGLRQLLFCTCEIDLFCKPRTCELAMNAVERSWSVFSVPHFLPHSPLSCAHDTMALQANLHAAVEATPAGSLRLLRIAGPAPQQRGHCAALASLNLGHQGNDAMATPANAPSSTPCGNTMLESGDGLSSEAAPGAARSVAGRPIPLTTGAAPHRCTRSSSLMSSAFINKQL